MRDSRTLMLAMFLAATLHAAPGLAQQAPAPAPGSAPGPAPSAAPAAPATPPATNSATDASEPEEKADIKGFRSALWGMTEAQIREAIRKDFGQVRVTVEQNPADLTTLVWANVDNLLPGSGLGRVTYILGHTTKKLIQVSITWGGPINPSLKPEAAISVANLLRGHFATLTYKPDSVVQYAKAQDGSIVIFRGFDFENRMTLLVLSELTKQEGAPPTAPVVLQLSYVQNIQKPDIFRVNRGQF
jgi:hypothetical protein